MAQRGRPKAELVLSEEERDTLARWARRPNSPQSLALRSKIVLACAAGKTNRQVAAELHCNKVTVGKWRQRFVDKRLKGLADEYRPGVPRSITDDHVVPSTGRLSSMKSGLIPFGTATVLHTAKSRPSSISQPPNRNQ